jgi:TPR repeat protein
LGNPQAQVELAELYDAGEGVTQDTEQAVKWYEKAAEQGHEEAQLALALHYLEDLEDNATAIEYFDKAAEQGNATAQYRLGLIYLGDAGVPTNKLKAWVYFSLAADKVTEAAQARDVLELEMSNVQLKQATLALKQWQSSR